MGNKKTNEESKSKRTKTILFTIFGLIVAMIIGLVSYLIFTNNKTAQLDDFKEAIYSKDYDKVAKTLSSKDLKITHAEAKRFVDYMIHDNNRSKFKKEINHIKQNIENSNRNTVDFGFLTDNRNRKIIEVKMNGNKFLFVDKLAFNPILQKVFIENNSRSNAKFEVSNIENEQHVIMAKKNEITSIGEYLVGRYELDAVKIYDEDNSLINGKVQGNIRFNTDNINKNGNVIARTNFKGITFKVNIFNDEMLDNNIQIYINDKSIDYKSNKVYGEYPGEKPLKVYAKGKLGDKDFKTNTVTIESDQSAKSQKIELEFDGDNIDDYIRQVKDIKLHAKSFMEDYTKDLNKAYNERDYSIIESYIKSDSELEQHMRSMVEGKMKNQYKRPEFESVDYQNGQVKVVLKKQNQNKDMVKSKYVLEYQESDESFKILNYQDV
ncbi:TcaA second domain-containing protein [Staphylococcus aureus]|uniref:TcaA second domain-containing protein n=1 Tax=Staphylococcus aureus TaxID=1280 RepID=UPI00404953AD